MEFFLRELCCPFRRHKTLLVQYKKALHCKKKKTQPNVSQVLYQLSEFKKNLTAQFCKIYLPSQKNRFKQQNNLQINKYNNTVQKNNISTSDTLVASSPWVLKWWHTEESDDVTGAISLWERRTGREEEHEERKESRFSSGPLVSMHIIHGPSQINWSIHINAVYLQSINLSWPKFGWCNGAACSPARKCPCPKNETILAMVQS